MIRVAGHSRFVIVALASILVGLLVGSSVALAHTGDTPKKTGEISYTVKHEGCIGHDCNYYHMHSAEEYDDWTGFNIHNTSYYDAGDNDGLVFAYMYIWDEYGENRVLFTNFFCVEIDNVASTEDTWWGWGEHDPPNYGTAVTQYIWYSNTCAYPDGAGAHEMTLYVD